MVKTSVTAGYFRTFCIFYILQIWILFWVLHWVIVFKEEPY